MSKKKPWYMLVLARMDERARCMCPTDALYELAKRISRAELRDDERVAINAELDRMLRENAGVYDQAGITFFIRFREQNVQRPWYRIILEHMAKFATHSGYMRNLAEAGNDLVNAEKKDYELRSICAGLDWMICEEGHLYKPKPLEYLKELLQRLAKQA